MFNFVFIVLYFNIDSHMLQVILLPVLLSHSVVKQNKCCEVSACCHKKTIFVITRWAAALNASHQSDGTAGLNI